MVPKPLERPTEQVTGFRAVLFRMVPKQALVNAARPQCFRAVLFRMVPKRTNEKKLYAEGFRAVLFRMVPKLFPLQPLQLVVLELCCFEWFQNSAATS